MARSAIDQQALARCGVASSVRARISSCSPPNRQSRVLFLFEGGSEDQPHHTPAFRAAEREACCWAKSGASARGAGFRAAARPGPRFRGGRALSPPSSRTGNVASPAEALQAKIKVNRKRKHQSYVRPQMQRMLQWNLVEVSTFKQHPDDFAAQFAVLGTKQLVEPVADLLLGAGPARTHHWHRACVRARPLVLSIRRSAAFGRSPGALFLLAARARARGSRGGCRVPA